MSINLLLIILTSLAALIQLWGAHLESRPCKYVKYSYAFSLALITSFILACWVGYPIEHACKYGLALLTFNVLIGGTVRLKLLLDKKRRRECTKHCGH